MEAQVSPLGFVNGEFMDIAPRGINRDTCVKYGYQIGKLNGKPCHVANYRNLDGTQVAQKYRFADKSFHCNGSPNYLFGQNLWPNGGKKLVITEGEIDCITVSQLQNNKWPVVSLKNGASGAAKDIAASLEFVSGYEQVILMFDMDEAGRAAIEEAVRVLPFGTARVAQLPFKDANECLLKGASGEVVDQVWKAKQWTPDGIVSVNDVAEEARRPVELDLP